MNTNSSNIFVSICLTTYNRASVLGRTIESILNQSHVNFELVISDDCSTDNTKEVCEYYSLKDPRVRYFRNTTNLKMPGNLNAAISRTQYSYIANLHDGDVYRPDLIQKWLNVISLDENILFVFNQYKEVDNRGELVSIHNHNFDMVCDGFRLREYMYINLSSAPWGTVMVRREAYDKYGYFNSKYGFISDVEMWMRLSCYGKFGYVNEPLIELTPRERSHKYFFPSADIFLLNTRIAFNYYLKDKESYYINGHFISKRLQFDLFRNILILLKNLKFERLREFHFIVSHSNFIFLKLLVIVIFFVGKKKPTKYDEMRWKEINFNLK
jgi:glycosyltransferase involved in cell wall biosynthesis